MKPSAVTLAERGQIVSPKAARDALGLKPGAGLQLRVKAVGCSSKRRSSSI